MCRRRAPFPLKLHLRLPLNHHGGGQVSLREVLAGMIKEYARHSLWSAVTRKSLITSALSPNGNDGQQPARSG